MITIEKPTANPYQSPPGPVLLTTRVKASSEDIGSYMVRTIVYEGSWWPGHGTELWHLDQHLWIGSNWTTFEDIHSSTEGTIDRRDVKVEVWTIGVLPTWEQFLVTSKE